MKKRILSLILCAALAAGLLTPAFAVQEVPADVLLDAPGLELLNTIPLMGSTEEETFLQTPSGLPPTIPNSGFLIPIVEPLPTPGQNDLLCDFSDSIDRATAVSTVEEFLSICAGGNYYLANDIDLSTLTDWTGITLSGSLTLDGQGHTISGLSYTLFKGKGPVTLRNLVIESAETGVSGCSVLFSNDSALSSSTVTLDNCTIRGTFLPDIKGSSGIGTFVGYNTNEASAITNCAFLGTLDASTTGNSTKYAGGIAGSFSGLIENCYVDAQAKTGEYALASYCGGIVGNVNKDIRRCTAILSGEWHGSYMGGIAGSCNGNVSDCSVILAEDMQLGGNSFTGGIVSSCKAVENCWVRGGAVWGPKGVGGIAYEASGSVSNCYAVTNLMGAGPMSGIVVSAPGGLVSDCVAQVTFTNPDDNGYGGAGITSKAKIVQRCAAYGNLESAGTVAGIAYYAEEVRDCTAAVTGATVGIVYEGNAYNCYVNGATDLTCGIAYTANTIVDCAVRNSECSSSGIVYEAAGTVSGCLVKDSVISSTDLAGGIAVRGTTISDCQVIGCTILSASTEAGGIEAYLHYRDKNKVISDCTVTDCTITSPCYAGGILGRGDMSGSLRPMNTYVISDCITEKNIITSTGSYTEEITDPFDVDSYAGGIIGYGYGATILACKANNTVKGFFAGGIAGEVDHTVQSCSASGSVYGEYYAGGLAGPSARSVDGCYTNADVTGETYIGGLFGYMDTTVTNCEAAGTVTGKSTATAMGGLAGLAREAKLTSLTFSGTFAGEFAAYTGGLIGEGSSSVANNCHITQPISLTSVTEEQVYFGALLGYNNDTASTSFYYCSCVDIDVSGPFRYVGGMVGFTYPNVYLEHCTIDGDVRISTTGAFVGAFTGLNAQKTVLADCWINGDVVINAPSSITLRAGIYCGQNEDDLIVYNSNILKSAADPSFAISVNGVTDTARDCGSGNEPIEEDDYAFHENAVGNRPVTISVFGGYYGGDSGFPLAGAKVTIGDISGYTNTSGIVSLQCGDKAYKDAVEILIEKEGYPTYRNYHCFSSNMSTYSATLWRLAPEKIMIESGSVQLTSNRTRNIFSDVKVRFAQDDKMLYNVSVNVNWNGHTPDRVYLRGMKSGRTMELQVTDWGASGLVGFGSSFDADEYIQVVAVTKEDETYGVLEARTLTNLMVQSLEVHIVVTEPGDGTPVSSGEEESTFFMEDAKFKLDMKDLIDGAASISLENNVLTVTFKSTNTEKTTGDLLALNDLYTKDDVYLSGTISVPYTDMENGEWSGNIIVGLNQSTGVAVDGQKVYKDMVDLVEADNSLHVHTFGFTVAGVPCYVETGIGVGGSAKLEVYGTLNKPETKGSLTASVTGEAGLGIGGAIAGGKVQYAGESAVEVKLGGYGSLTGKAIVEIDTKNGFHMNPSLSGDLGAKVSVHLFVIDFEDQLSVGEFTWDKTGLVWRFAGEEGSTPVEGEKEASLSLMSADAEQWQLIGRDYLNNAAPDDADIQLFAVNGGTIEVENIIQVAELANSSTVKYHTADDTTITDQQNAMKLYATVGNNTYIVDDTATSDLSPSAEGNFVSWIDVKPTEENDLASFLRNTEIAVSQYDSTNRCFTEKVILTDESADSHVYSPVTVIPGNGNGKAAVAWLSADMMPDGQLDFTPDEVEVWCATYDGTTWSDAILAATVDGTVSSLQAAYGLGSDIDTLYLDYQVDGNVYEIAVTSTSETDAEIGQGTTTVTTSDPKLLLENAYAFVRDYNYYSWQNEKGLYLGTLTSGTWLDPHGLMNEAPVFSVYPSGMTGAYCRYVYWAVGNQIWGSYSNSNYGTKWSEPQLLCEEDGYIHELSLFTTGNFVPSLRYLVDTENGTHLVTQNSNLTKNAKIERVVLTADTLEVTMRQYAINTTSAVRNSWALYDTKTNTKLLSQSESIVPGATATVVIDRDEIPETGEFRFDITGDSYTFTIVGDEIPALVSIEDILWENDVLHARLLPAGSACEEMTLTVTDQQGNLVDAWTVASDDYVRGLLYLADRQLPLEDGIYMLTVAMNNATDCLLFGVGDPLTKEPEGVFLDGLTTGGGKSEIKLFELGSILHTELLVLAAQHSDDGQMVDVVFGTLEAVNEVWTIDIPCEVASDWTVYLLDPVTYAPVCEALTGF